MTESQQKLYIDRDSARQFLFYKTDSKIPDINGPRVLKIAQKILFVLLLIFFCSSAEAVEGPIIVNTDVLSGSWKVIRLKNLPKNAVVALEIKSDGEIMVMLVDSNDYQSFPNTSRPLFMGRVEKKLSFSVSISESGHYYVILDNRTGPRKRAITVTAAAARGEIDQINAANTILRAFERQLHQIFIFDSFPVGVERCDTSKTFADRLEIILCAGYVQQLYNHIQTAQKSLVQAKENWRITNLQYQQQMTTSTEVLDARTFLTQAETNYYGALYGYMISLAELERAVGEIEP